MKLKIEAPKELEDVGKLMQGSVLVSILAAILAGIALLVAIGGRNAH